MYSLLPYKRIRIRYLNFSSTLNHLTTSSNIPYPRYRVSSAIFLKHVRITRIPFRRRHTEVHHLQKGRASLHVCSCLLYRFHFRRFNSKGNDTRFSTKRQSLVSCGIEEERPNAYDELFSYPCGITKLAEEITDAYTVCQKLWAQLFFFFLTILL